MKYGGNKEKEHRQSVDCPGRREFYTGVSGEEDCVGVKRKSEAAMKLKAQPWHYLCLLVQIVSVPLSLKIPRFPSLLYSITLFSLSKW